MTNTTAASAESKSNARFSFTGDFTQILSLATWALVVSAILNVNGLIHNFRLLTGAVCP